MSLKLTKIHKILNLKRFYPIRVILSLLTPRDKSIIKRILLFQILFAFLDLFGVILLGALGALSIQGIESRHPGNRVNSLLKLFYLSHLSFAFQIGLLGIFAAAILIFKSVLSVVFLKRSFSYLSAVGSRISGNLMEKILSTDLLSIQSRSSQEILYIVSQGVNNLMTGILATSMLILSDISTLTIVTIGLLWIDPGIALITVFFFFLIALALHRFLQIRSNQLGMMLQDSTVKSNKKILEVLWSYRELVVRNRRSYYVNDIRNLQLELGNIGGELSVQPYMSKYVIELSIVIGSLILGSFEFGTKNAVHAVAALSLFLAASSRLAPAVLRIQQGLQKVKISSGSAGTTLELISELNTVERRFNESLNPDFNYIDFTPAVSIHNVSFKYPNADKFAVSNINFSVPVGQSIAIVGKSGAGKSTLVDLILGILEPDNGFVEISGTSPSNACSRWSGAISYVPQSLDFIDGTVRENVGLGYSEEVTTDEKIWNALDFAQLSEFVQTSSMDAQTESEISSSISGIVGKTTLIVVAHRLSTIRSFSRIIYLEEGRIEADGTFDEIRKLIPDFNNQAELMGL
jgi:ABC-type multidrug transport system fused ATPase/permease subunit